MVYRTLDLKSNEYIGLEGGDRFEVNEENPMLGFRGCSRYLADEESFRLELRAVKWPSSMNSASAACSVMRPPRYSSEFPMTKASTRSSGKTM